MEVRREFVDLARQEGANIRQLCRRFGISPPTAYKWLARFAAEGEAGLVDHSRRPACSPHQTPVRIEAAVLAVREQFPTWGGRKIAAWLTAHASHHVPSPSTITRILDRYGRLVDTDQRQGAYQRFEAAAPNDLWQMDFKGHFALATGRCHPLSILDDHSRYLLWLVACGDEQQTTVQTQLIQVFERYGLPRRILSDNGAAWSNNGNTGNGGRTGGRYGGISALEIWLVQLGIAVSHGRPGHPQTQGKVERFHRTLKAEVISGAPFADLASCQAAFDRWRVHYNTERPHDALALAVPSSCYQLSPRPYPAELPVLSYAPDEVVRVVKATGIVAYQGRQYRVGKGLRGQRVALRPTRDPHRLGVYLGRQHITDVVLDQDRNV